MLCSGGRRDGKGWGFVASGDGEGKKVEGMVDGKMFDSSYERGEDIEFPLNRVISGWTEGLGLMRPCDAWTFYIPSDLAYGPQGGGPIPPATPIMFHVQLIEVNE